MLTAASLADETYHPDTGGVHHSKKYPGRDRSGRSGRYVFLSFSFPVFKYEEDGWEKIIPLKKTNRLSRVETLQCGTPVLCIFARGSYALRTPDPCHILPPFVLARRVLSPPRQSPLCCPNTARTDTASFTAHPALSRTSHHRTFPHPALS